MMVSSLPFNQDYLARHVHPRSRSRDNRAEPDYHKLKKTKSTFEVRDLSNRGPVPRSGGDSSRPIDVESYRGSTIRDESPDPVVEKLWHDIDQYCDSVKAAHNLCPNDNNSGNLSTGLRRNMDHESGSPHCGIFDEEKGCSSSVGRQTDTTRSLGYRDCRVRFESRGARRSSIPLRKRSRWNGRTFNYPPSRRDLRRSRTPINRHISVSGRSREATKVFSNLWEGSVLDRSREATNRSREAKNTSSNLWEGYVSERSREATKTSGNLWEGSVCSREATKTSSNLWEGSVSDHSRESTKTFNNLWEGLERTQDINPRSREETPSGFTSKDRSREATKTSSNLWEGFEHWSPTKARTNDMNPISREETGSGFTCKAQVDTTTRDLQKGAIGNNEDRERVMKTLRLFRAISNELRQEDERKKRIEYEAARVIKGMPNYLDYGKHIGPIPGVEVGDEFFNRMEVAIVGLHKPPEFGIDFTKDGTDNICTSIVAMGGGEYANDMSTWESLIYCGHGGNVGRARKEPEDQRLEGGNLALKNSISHRNEVRVIRANKESGLKGEVERIYIYDGLYTVERYWHEKAEHGKLVFKFKLRRIPGQPSLCRSHWIKLGAY